MMRSDSSNSPWWGVGDDISVIACLQPQHRSDRNRCVPGPAQAVDLVSGETSI